MAVFLGRLILIGSSRFSANQSPQKNLGLSLNQWQNHWIILPCCDSWGCPGPDPPAKHDPFDPSATHLGSIWVSTDISFSHPCDIDKWLEELASFYKTIIPNRSRSTYTRITVNGAFWSQACSKDKPVTTSTRGENLLLNVAIAWTRCWFLKMTLAAPSFLAPNKRLWFNDPRLHNGVALRKHGQRLFRYPNGFQQR